MQKKFHIIENLMQRIKDSTEDGFTVVYFVLWSDHSKVWSESNFSLQYHPWIISRRGGKGQLTKNKLKLKAIRKKRKY